MRTKLFLAFATGILCVGCGPSFPEMPSATSRQARDCLRKCQHEHNACADACTDGDNVTKFGSREACVDYCVEALEGCYSRCESMGQQR